MSFGAFVVAFAVIIVLRHSEYLVGKTALIAALVLLVFAPTSSVLSRRLFFNLLLFMGLMPLIWWVPERFLGTDHGSIVLASATGLIAAWIFAEPGPGLRVRKLLPRVRAIDAIPFMGAAASALSLWTMLRIGKAEDALSLFLTRWDYQSHFNIYEMLRTHGAVIPVIPRISPDLSWGFVEYPQGFHALVATMGQFRERDVSSLDGELISFMQLQAVVAVLTVMMLLAGLCSLNYIRQRAMVMAPLLAVTTAVWVYGPGSIAMYEGFANFYLACGMAAAAAIVMCLFRRNVPPLGLAVLAASVIGVFHNWFILATLFVVPLVFFLWWTLRGLGRLDLRGRMVFVGWCTVGVVGAVLPLVQAGTVIAQSAVVVSALGGIALPDFGFAIVSVGVVMFLGISGLGRHAASITRSRNVATLIALGIAFPVLVSVGLAVSQIRQIGEVAYYFHKYLVAVMLFAWPVATIAFASLVSSRAESFWRKPKRRVQAGLGVLALSATQVFGFTAIGLREYGLEPTASPVVQKLQQRGLLGATPEHVRRLLISAKLEQPDDTVYVASSQLVDPILAARWQWGMRARATQKTTDMSSYLGRLRQEPGQEPAVIVELLRANDGTTLLVDAEEYQAMKLVLEDHGLHGRIMPVG